MKWGCVVATNRSRAMVARKKILKPPCFRKAAFDLLPRSKWQFLLDALSFYCMFPGTKEFPHTVQTLFLL